MEMTTFRSWCVKEEDAAQHFADMISNALGSDVRVTAQPPIHASQSYEVHVEYTDGAVSRYAVREQVTEFNTSWWELQQV